MNTKIQLDGVVKIFGGDATGRPLEMLHEGATNADIREETGHVVGVGGVSLDIHEGEVFVVMGLSGSGKSTLIRCINRIHEPTDGRVIVDGEDVTALDLEQVRDVRRRKMAMVFQHFALFPHKTVLENAAYGLRMQGVDADQQRARATEALELVGLEDWAELYPHNLSGGMQQRVGLARALAPDPDILLMDEAFSALDPLIRRQMQDELLTLQQQVRKTIVFITHDLNEALRIGTRVMIMKEGRTVQIGTPTQIVTQPEDQYVADFMADVDHAKVLPASYVMSEPSSVGSAASVDDMRDALGAADLGYVVDGDHRPVAVFRAEDLAEASGTAADVASPGFATARTTATLAALFPLSGDGRPVAIVDDAGRLVGSVSALDILRTLGEVEVVDDPPSEVSV
ncbi:MAG: betaine/proline/choline family ABC transporter ATP-binding protein [Nitriliruptoraceae bacterium]